VEVLDLVMVAVACFRLRCQALAWLHRMGDESKDTTVTTQHQQYVYACVKIVLDLWMRTSLAQG
jgi:hypothetical protein